MNESAWAMAGLFAGVVLFFSGIFIGDTFSEPDCPDGAVFAWQQNAGSEPGDREWACVQLADLNKLMEGRN